MAFRLPGLLLRGAPVPDRADPGRHSALLQLGVLLQLHQRHAAARPRGLFAQVVQGYPAEWRVGAGRNVADLGRHLAQRAVGQLDEEQLHRRHRRDLHRDHARHACRPRPLPPRDALSQCDHEPADLAHDRAYRHHGARLVLLPGEDGHRLYLSWPYPDARRDRHPVRDHHGDGDAFELRQRAHQGGPEPRRATVDNLPQGHPAADPPRHGVWCAVRLRHVLRRGRARLLHRRH